MEVKTKVTYTYRQVALCSDGCCTENESVITFDDEEEVLVWATLFDYTDLVEWLTAEYGPKWSESYYVATDECMFY